MKLVIVLAIIGLLVLAGCSSSSDVDIQKDQPASASQVADPIEQVGETIVAENDSVEIGEMI